jgi:hypothetical protein
MMRAFLSKIFTSTSIPRDIFLTLVGGLIGLATSHVYYLRAVSDMQGDAAERKRVEELIFRAIENIGSMNYVRDEAGKVVGVQIQFHGSAQAHASGSATLTAAPPGERQ